MTGRGHYPSPGGLNWGHQVTSTRPQTGARIPTTFSLIPDPGQNKEDISIISAVTYGAYILLSRPIQFCPFPNQYFEKNSQNPADPAEPWIQDPSGFFRFSWGSNHVVKEIPCHIKRYNVDNQAQYSEVP